jgi:MFS family permease
MLKMMMRVLHQREFRLLWLGQSASTVGDRLVLPALALYVTDVGTASDVGIVLAANAIPLLAFVLLGGVIADRLPRHRLMMATDLVRAALHALLAALILAGTAEVWMIAAIEAVYGAAQAFFQPAYTGLVPQTVSEDLLQDANAATFAANNVAAFVGPALATAIVLGVGAGWAFVLDAATFLVSAAALARLRPRSRGVTATAAPLMAELRAGWSEFTSRAWLWGVVGLFSIMLLVALAPYFVLGATVAEDLYGSRALFGTLVAAMGAGTILGASIGFHWRPERPMFAAMVVNLPWTAAITLFAAGAPRGLVIAAFFVAGTGFSLFQVLWHTALAQRIPPHALSRVSSYDWLGSLALLPVGYLLAGPLGEAFGAADVLAVGATLGFALAVAGLAIPDVRRLRALDVPG